MAEVTTFRNNALPYPVYGAPWVVVFPMLDEDGDPVTGLTCDSEISKNGDTGADCTNEGTEILFTTATNKGMYYLILTAAEMTADVVAVTVYSGAATTQATCITLYPRKLVSLLAGTSAGGNTAYITLPAAGGVNDDTWNGCLCVAVIDTLVEARVITDYTGSNQRAAVTPGWNVAPDADDTFIIYLPEGMQRPVVDLGAIKGTPLPAEAAAGQVAAGFAKFYDVATPAGTVNLIAANLTQIDGKLTNGPETLANRPILYLQRLDLHNDDPSNAAFRSVNDNASGSGAFMYGVITGLAVQGGVNGLAAYGTSRDIQLAESGLIGNYLNVLLSPTVVAGVTAANLAETGDTMVTAADAMVADYARRTGDYATPTNITAGVITTVTTLTNPVTLANGAHGGNAASMNLASGLAANITGNITGNLSGTVGSVTGAVGSVTGAVASVTGAVGSVTGAVGSVTGAVASVTGAVGSVTGAVGSVTGAVVLPAIPNNWIAAAGIAATALNGKGDWNVGKSGYALTQGFPTNFADLSISATTGLVATAATQHVIVDSGTVTTVTNQLTAAQIATGVWADATGGTASGQWYVSKAGNNGNSGRSWAKAKLTIASAIAGPVADGETINIGPGTFVENIDLSGSNGITIQGSRWNTILQDTGTSQSHIKLGHRCRLYDLYIDTSAANSCIVAGAKNDWEIARCKIDSDSAAAAIGCTDAWRVNVHDCIIASVSIAVGGGNSGNFDRNMIEITNTAGSAPQLLAFAAVGAVNGLLTITNSHIYVHANCNSLPSSGEAVGIELSNGRMIVRNTLIDVYYDNPSDGGIVVGIGETGNSAATHILVDGCNVRTGSTYPVDLEFALYAAGTTYLDTIQAYNSLFNTTLIYGDVEIMPSSLVDDAITAAAIDDGALDGKGNWNTVVPDAAGTLAALIGAKGGLPKLDSTNGLVVQGFGSGGVTVGTVTTVTNQLTATQIRDALKLAPTSGAPATGSVDKHLDDIQAKTDGLGSIVAEFVSHIVSGDDGEIYGGDSYLDADSRAFTVVVTGWSGPSLTGATVKLRLLPYQTYLEAATKAATLEVTATAVNNSGTLTCKADLTATQTAALAPSPPADSRNYWYQFRATLTDLSIVTLAEGRLTVKKGLTA